MNFYSPAPLEAVVFDAYSDEEIHGEVVHDALDELKFRGYSKDEVYSFVTWGDN